MAFGVFVAGTDTGIGKTTVAVALVRALAGLGAEVAAMKPVAAGCRRTPEGLRNDDAEALRRAATVSAPYETVNPVALEPPIAPHIAAAETGSAIDLNRVEIAYRDLAARADFCVVEGAGGWLVPLDEGRTMADLVGMLGLTVVVVVGVRLGCINHALLTAESVERHGAPFAGWVANTLASPAERPEANIETLRRRLAAPLLDTVPHLAPGTPASPAHLVSAARSLLGMTGMPSSPPR